MTDSITEGSESSNTPEVDFDGLEQGANPTPTGEERGENGQSILDFLKSRSPDKDLGQYEGHALDFDNSDSTRRLIRGLEGLFDDLNYAVVDIIVGLVQKVADLGSSAAGQDSQGDPFIDEVNQG
ncbi:MAG: hypothetical protein ABEJ98_05165 [Candidatus Nanohaloarchaea archaeon]